MILRVRMILARALSQKGFSVIEVLVASVILVVGLISLSHFFSQAAVRVLEGDVRTVLHQVANEEMETIRGLPYEDVGTVDGAVEGVLEPSETRDVDGVDIRVERSVQYETDPTYEGPYYANYRQVTIKVTALSADGEDLTTIAPFSLTSYVAGGAAGGAILVRVQNACGEAIEGAYFTIVNTALGVNYTASNQLTDETGTMLVPGLIVDSSGGYVVTATKLGYSSDVAEDFPVLEAGLQEVILTIDLLSSMHVRVVDQTTGLDIEGISVSIVGPQEYSTLQVTGATGFSLSGLRFSTEDDPYIVRVVSGQGYEAEQCNVTLSPGAINQEVILEVIPSTATTTTESTTTTTLSSTTTLPSVTTTLPGYGSLRVTVREWDGSKLRSRAIVQLGTQSKSNKNNIVLFEDLQYMDYPLIVTANHYVSYETTVTITGANTITVYLNRD